MCLPAGALAAVFAGFSGTAAAAGGAALALAWASVTCWVRVVILALAWSSWDLRLSRSAVTVCSSCLVLSSSALDGSQPRAPTIRDAAATRVSDRRFIGFLLGFRERVNIRRTDGRGRAFR